MANLTVMVVLCFSPPHQDIGAVEKTMVFMPMRIHHRRALCFRFDPDDLAGAELGWAILEEAHKRIRRILQLDIPYNKLHAVGLSKGSVAVITSPDFATGHLSVWSPTEGDRYHRYGKWVSLEALRKRSSTLAAGFSAVFREYLAQCNR